MWQYSGAAALRRARAVLHSPPRGVRGKLPRGYGECRSGRAEAQRRRISSSVRVRECVAVVWRGGMSICAHVATEEDASQRWSAHLRSKRRRVGAIVEEERCNVLC